MLVVVGVVVLGLSACSSSAKTTSSTTTPATTTPTSSEQAPSTTAAQSTTTAPATTTTTAGAQVDSCTVVTQAQAGAALGQAVRAPVRGKATVEGGVACVFYGPSVPAGADPDVPVPNSVRVVLVTGSDATSFFNDFRSKVPAQAISGLGDQAYYDGSASLSVLKGTKYLRIAVIGTPGVLAAEKLLASDALQHM